MGVTKRIHYRTRRYYLVGLPLVSAGVCLVIVGSVLPGAADPSVRTVLISVGSGLIPAGIVMLSEPWLIEDVSEQAQEIASVQARETAMDVTFPERAPVRVLSGGRPLSGASVVALAPNRTFKQASTNSEGDAFLELSATDVPRTVFVAAEDHGAHVEPDWIPAEGGLTVDLSVMAGGGSAVFPTGTGHVPGMNGRLNPILDTLNRTYIYATNIAIDGGQQQPVEFVRGSAMRMQDADDNEFQVSVVEIVGSSSLIEYRRVPR